MLGEWGMQAEIDDNNLLYVVDETPQAELRYRARLERDGFKPSPPDPNSLQMASGASHPIFQGHKVTGSVTPVWKLHLRRQLSAYYIQAYVRRDNGAWLSASALISDAQHALEIDWKAASAPGANNGSLTLWVDGQPKVNLTGADNDTHRTDQIRLGVVGSPQYPNVRGVYCFDAFVSRRQNPIGTASGVQACSGTLEAQGSQEAPQASANVGPTSTILALPK